MPPPCYAAAQTHAAAHIPFAAELSRLEDPSAGNRNDPHEGEHPLKRVEYPQKPSEVEVEVEAEDENDAVVAPEADQPVKPVSAARQLKTKVIRSLSDAVESIKRQTWV
jgi:hypothetical protein